MFRLLQHHLQPTLLKSQTPQLSRHLFGKQGRSLSPLLPQLPHQHPIHLRCFFYPSHQLRHGALRLGQLPLPFF